MAGITAMARLFRIVLLIALFLFPAAIGNANYQQIHYIHYEDYSVISKYDSMIKAATAKHLPPGYDWRLYKSQLWEESKLDPMARNARTGADGMAQFMRPTWEEWSPKAGYPSEEPTDPEAAIFTGAAYMRYLIDFWYAERPDADRHCLAMASYNAGPFNLLKAQKLQGGKALYADIIPALPKVTSLNALETINYVRSIMANCNGLVTGEISNG